MGSSKHEFKVQLDGIELSEEQAHRVNAAVRAAVLRELVELEVPDYRVVLVSPEDLTQPGFGIGVRVIGQ
ncbi:hypothetical protein [Paractinoplanes toevensis]|uniref:Uncharacterized protein n=1 Tax=Paractinoplanes toevensis TaxID=571911 RepID=A0A919W5W1_9ACTN|nr:hypothetical protein [Actinoplanes toevensis]GIM91908.1 hypothetical protein Ato02nite_037010 [Actinoplanes toevensis]